MKSYVLCLSIGRIVLVLTCFLPLGILSIIDKSKSPQIVKASDLGIGVAVIESKCGILSLFSRQSSFLCLTPNLCCSSIITRPKFLNSTLGLLFLSFLTIRACVPISTSISPFLHFSSSFCLDISIVSFLSLYE